MMKKLLLAVAIPLALGSLAAKAADPIVINPDAGGADPTINTFALGWQNGNAISVGTALPVATDDVIQTYAHATLANFTDGDGNSVVPSGLNASGGYEWTYVLGFQEKVTSATGAPPNANANFQVIAGGDNFFQIWFDTSRDADNLTGKGFNDGILILSGTILPFDGSNGTSTFTATGINATDPDLDNFGTDNYTNIDSVTGNGSTSLLIQVASFNSSFFTGLAVGEFISLDYDAFQNTPYSQQNPSSCFWNGSAYIIGAGTITNGGSAAQLANDCEGAPSIGAINGVSGPNFMFETRGSSAFNVEKVPEPATLALLGVGLAGLGVMRRPKNRQ